MKRVVNIQIWNGDDLIATFPGEADQLFAVGSAGELLVRGSKDLPAHTIFAPGHWTRLDYTWVTIEDM